jgi:hypothetical protein
MSIVRLEEGRDYQKDNLLLWGSCCYAPWSLRQLLGIMHVKQYDTKQDGCSSAFLAPQIRGEGEAHVDARCAAAEEIIQMSKYTCKSKQFSIQHFQPMLARCLHRVVGIHWGRGVGPAYLEAKQRS